MDRADMRQILRRSSPLAKSHDIEQYLSAFEAWHQADAHIRENGPISVHPRTGAPFDNPYVAVRDRSYKTMAGCRAVLADALWAALPPADIEPADD